MGESRKCPQAMVQGLIGELVSGTVKAVLPHGVFVDLGLDHIGHIDPMYIEDLDNYQIGDRVRVHLEGFTEHNEEYRLRPPGKPTMAEWLQRRRTGDNL